MLKSKRIQEIQEYVLKHQTVSLDELVTTFNVSKNTIRRDIQRLVERGEIKKVYGGVSVNNTTLISFHERQTQNQAQKKIIGKLAGQFVEDGDIIFIDSGTTTLEMFGFIKEKNVTVVTNNLAFIIDSLPYENLNIISIGGILQRKTNSYASFTETNILKRYNVNKAFMASTGVSLSHGVTNASPVESELKETAVSRSSEVFLLVDHGKFDKHGLVTFCDLSDIDYLVTDQMPEEKYLDYSHRHDIQVIVPE